MNELESLLGAEIYSELVALRLDAVCEIRMRLGKPITVFDGKKWRKLLKLNKTAARICDQHDIDFTLGEASGYSLYAVNDSLTNEYLSYKGGIRIGATGVGVMDGGRFCAIKNIAYLCIRAPHQVFGCSDKLFDQKDCLKNYLIVSPPSAGKTTMLRELARKVSNAGHNVLVIDERFELAAEFKGTSALDVGENTDVISGVSNLVAFENVIRCMNPDFIVTDEIFTLAEAESLLQAIRGGVRVAASIHEDSIDAAKRGGFERLVMAFDKIAVLSKFPSVGSIVEVVKC